MSWHTVGWFLTNMHRAFAGMDDGELNRVSETLNTEMNQREEAAAEGSPRGRSASRPGRDRSRPPPREQTQRQMQTSPAREQGPDRKP